jgi:hypothetical protein
VARIVSALIAGHDVEARREQIDDLSLAFIAPLGAEDDKIHGDSLTILLDRAPTIVK